VKQGHGNVPEIEEDTAGDTTFGGGDGKNSFHISTGKEKRKWEIH
jgi:hypothetical protein